MTIRAVGRDFVRRHVFLRRHFAVRPLAHPFRETKSIVDAAIRRSLENRPRPPFSLSGTVSYVAYSRTFYHFLAGELLLALLLRHRAEWNRVYPPPFDCDGGRECCPDVPVATQADQIASRVRHAVPTTDDGAQGNAVGTRLDLLA